MANLTTQTTIGVNANATSTTIALDIRHSNLVTMQVIANTGGNTTHVIDLQCSTNSSNWHNVTGGSINQLGITGALDIATQFVRGRVSTNEGSASTVDIIINAK